MAYFLILRLLSDLIHYFFMSDATSRDFNPLYAKRNHQKPHWCTSSTQITFFKACKLHSSKLHATGVQESKQKEALYNIDLASYTKNLLLTLLVCPENDRDDYYLLVSDPFFVFKRFNFSIGTNRQKMGTDQDQ